MIRAWNWLKRKWNVESNSQMAVIFLIFSITGSGAAFLRRYLFNILGIEKFTPLLFYYLLQTFVIIICYQILLVVIGILLGQRKFVFWFFRKMNRHFVPAWKKEFQKKTK